MRCHFHFQHFRGNSAIKLILIFIVMFKGLAGNVIIRAVVNVIRFDFGFNFLHGWTVESLRKVNSFALKLYNQPSNQLRCITISGGGAGVNSLSLSFITTFTVAMVEVVVTAGVVVVVVRWVVVVVTSNPSSANRLTWKSFCDSTVEQWHEWKSLSHYLFEKSYQRKDLAIKAAAIRGIRKAVVDPILGKHKVFVMAFPLYPTMQFDRCLSSPHISLLRYLRHTIVHKSPGENCVGGRMKVINDLRLVHFWSNLWFLPTLWIFFT